MGTPPETDSDPELDIWKIHPESGHETDFWGICQTPSPLQSLNISDHDNTGLQVNPTNVEANSAY